MTAETMPLTTADRWAIMYGETLKVKGAAKILNMCVNTVYKHIELGHFKRTLDGRINTRSIAEYVERSGATK